MVAERRRLYLAELPAAGGRVTLSADTSKHARVLRLGSDAPVELFDGRGGVADAHVRSTEGGALVCEAAPARHVPRPAPALALLVGLPKGGKLEGIVRMVGELGVASLHPVLCSRSVPRPASADGRARRLERIALEASAQSGQPWALEVHPVAPLLEAAAAVGERDRRWVFWERSTAPLDASLERGAPSPVRAACIVGPEGGFEASEVEALSALGYRDVGLGAARLRVETAAVVAAALLLERLGRLS